MKIEQSYYLGYISKIIGHKGELAFKLDVDSPSDYQGLDAVLIQMMPKDNSLIPFFISSAQIQSANILRVKMEGVDDASEAKKLVGKSIFLPLERLPKLSGNQFYFHEIIGYDVEDEVKGMIGKVDRVLEYPQSNLLSVLVNEREVLIPILDATILGLDREKEIIKVKAPEGLIDLYLNS
ncbi:MAG: 16S rRNA processing protein RimM [Flavobacteriales bacterium]|nr:16S rRNA processing protein RimM [Flavobacteriales bacterium]|tara:strand:+ start:453 stop:992 length:540 start_codon:yes stop_codon:yes gene_type:complete